MVGRSRSMFKNDSKFRIMQHSSQNLRATESGRTNRPEELPASTLARMRLLIALDALLVEGSVTGAARTLQMSVPAMSRVLSQIRELYGDDIVTRSGRSLVPTPLAESLRIRVRALAEEAGMLLQNESAVALPLLPTPSDREVPTLQGPALAVRPTMLTDGEPGRAELARRLKVGKGGRPKQRLASYISTAGAGVGQSRPLTRTEACDALLIILEGEADPVQIGALLVALQYRGINANELAGMAEAARRNCTQSPRDDGVVQLDWPAYRSPRNKTPPWFLLAAKLIADTGRRVALHGFGAAPGTWHGALADLGIRSCMSLDQARSDLSANGIAYVPLTAIDPQMQALMSLYRLFEMRSPLSQVVQLLNPLGATHSFVGVPSRAARTLQRDAAEMLGFPNFAAIVSSRDLAQATPFRLTEFLLIANGKQYQSTIPARSMAQPRNPRNGFGAVELCLGLWRGTVRDADATEIVVSTAACALMALSEGGKDYDEAHAEAAQMWSERKTR